MASAPSPEPAKVPMSGTAWLICSIAAIGFAFDIYELLMMPLIARPALAELLGVDAMTQSGFDKIVEWTSLIMWSSAICGGTFGLLGGYLTDWFGRRRVLTYSILLYAFSALAAGFSVNPVMLLVLRCTTFIGVCVEFVAAVAWLAELFPNPKQREAVLGYTQAFSSVGGLLVTVAFLVINHYAKSLPAIFGEFDPAKGQTLVWRYTLISGVIPALPLILIRPFLPESPVWQQKKLAGTLRRPSVLALFQGRFVRTTLVTTLLFACSYGAAFGAIQFLPQIVPGLVKELAPMPALRREMEKPGTTPQRAAEIRAKIRELGQKQEAAVGGVQTWQEVGGLAGRFALAFLVVRIASRRKLLRIFQVPGLIIVPLVFALPAAGKTPSALLEALGTDHLTVLKIGVFLAGFLVVAQFSFWGNYLPLVYPVHLRGTGESFAANVGGRMFGTGANALTGWLLAPFFIWMAQKAGTQLPRPTSLAYAAALTALIVFAVGVAASFALPEPKRETMQE
jgi:MFS family permease